MDYNILIYASGAFLVSLFTQYLVIDLSHKRGIFIDDHTSDLPQKLHNEPTPRIGGLGIFVACMFMTKDLDNGLKIILCLIPAFLAGFLEDLFAKISPLRRLLIMSISAGMAIYLINAVVLDFGFISVPYGVGVFISIIAILGLINGTNLIDGFNGLSAGVCFLIFTTYFVISLRVHDEAMMLISLVCMGAILGFLVFNFPYGKIFLGDGGAYSLGFMLAVLAMMIVNRHSDHSIPEDYISPWFALVCLIYPVWEVIFSFSRRMIIHRLSPLHPDSKHVHQLVFRNITNHNNPLTSLVIFPVVLLFNILAILFYNSSISLFIIAIVFVISYTIFYYVVSRREMRKGEL
jgi:UDP-N-acetylmuramyl pentapeptide phosphotransferase/UDP-N-acetylglucosamine-1-phosphate transferase